MALALKKLRQQTMVITGATSEIGLMTARMAARRGAGLVLAARTASRGRSSGIRHMGQQRRGVNVITYVVLVLQGASLGQNAS